MPIKDRAKLPSATEQSSVDQKLLFFMISTKRKRTPNGVLFLCLFYFADNADRGLFQRLTERVVLEDFDQQVAVH